MRIIIVNYIKISLYELGNSKDYMKTNDLRLQLSLSGTLVSDLTIDSTCSTHERVIEVTNIVVKLNNLGMKWISLCCPIYPK